MVTSLVKHLKMTPFISPGHVSLSSPPLNLYVSPCSHSPRVRAVSSLFLELPSRPLTPSRVDGVEFGPPGCSRPALAPGVCRPRPPS